MKQFIVEHRHDNVEELALRAKNFPRIDMRKAIVQIKGYQIAERKLPLWAQTPDILFPEHLSLEQCSSQLTAQYKVSVLSHVTKGEFADFTGGFGVDSAMIGRSFGHLTFIEQNSDLCNLASHNFPLLGLKNITILNSSCEDVIDSLPSLNLIFIDPARRDIYGRKTVAIADCTPDITLLQDKMLHISDWVMIKLSPMLDITSAETNLHSLQQIHIVCVNGECKEILALMNEKSTISTVEIVCVNISSNGTQRFSFTREAERTAECHYVDRPLRYLYEPNAAVIKACCFKSLASRLNVYKLHPNSHLYTSDHIIPDFPGRLFEVEQVLSMNKVDMKMLKSLGKANLTVRNFPTTVAELRKKLKLAEGGTDYLFATTMADERKQIIVCKKISNQ